MKTEEVIKSLEKLAEKLGTTAEKLFGYYVKNAKMYRVYFILELIITLAVLIAGILLTINLAPENSQWLVSNILWVSIGVTLCLIGLIGVIITLGRIGEFINSWVNPEYEAIRELLEKLMR
jgi:hypothetical protein